MIVGLNETRYYVVEDTAMVTVCAAVMEAKIDCPVGFPFNVSIQTFHDTAGILLILVSILLNNYNCI